MDNQEYWENRAAWRMYEEMQKAEGTADDIAKIYLQSSKYLQLQMEGIFERYRSKHKLSEADARRLLDSMDGTTVQEMLQKLRDGESDKAKKGLLAELEAPAYQARITRLMELQNRIDYVMQNIYHQEQQISTAFYESLAKDTYYRSIFETQKQTGLAFSFSHIVDKQIDRVLSMNWSGKHYSERIWKNTGDLAQELKRELLANLLTGRSEREAAEVISNRFASGAMQARRLVRTESCFVSGELTAKAYKECGIEHYRFLATLDLRTSETCRSMDGKVFPVSERQQEVNYPPMHPWCRSTTISTISDEELKKMERRAYNPKTGKTEFVPGSMTYGEWYKKYVEGNPEALAEEKAIKNHASDKKQYEQYKKILGKDIPDSFVKFQKMKYNESEKWEYIKGLKDYLGKYPDSDKRYYDIQEELKTAGIKQGIVLPAKPKQAFILPEGKRDPYHIMNRMLERNITDDDVRGYMSNAKCMFVQWNGQRQVFYSDRGAAVITKLKDDWIYKTTWHKEDFDESTETILEVINKHVK